MMGGRQANALVESSLVIGWLRQVSSGSLVCTYAAAIAQPGLRFVHRATTFLALNRFRRDDDMTITARAVAFVEGSQLFGGVERGLAAMFKPWPEGVVVGATRRQFQFLALKPWQRVRLVGWMLFIALVIYRLLTGFGQGRADMLGLALWGGGLALSIGLMVGCRAIAAAWGDRAGAKLMKD